MPLSRKEAILDVLDSYYESDLDYIRSTFANLKLDFFQDHELWIFYNKFAWGESPVLLANSFAGNLEDLFSIKVGLIIFL